eukprot:m.271318 g.271318  ORF g.271318 m.271318 type:complete len:53 (+) comp16268_c1_seq28:53-211(+)
MTKEVANVFSILQIFKVYDQDLKRKAIASTADITKADSMIATLRLLPSCSSA